MSIDRQTLLHWQVLLRGMLELIDRELNIAPSIVPLEQVLAEVRSESPRRAIVRQRRWKTAKGEHKEAWRVDFIDALMKRQRRQFETKEAAELFRDRIEAGNVAA